jgi:putative Mn2+ efflux pump MntP
MLRSGDDGDARRSRSLARAHGLALIGLGVAISVDELAIGLSIGLLDLPITSAVVIIAGQALVAAQLGLPVGAATSAALRERAEQAAALILIGIALVIHHAL